MVVIETKRCAGPCGLVLSVTQFYRNGKYIYKRCKTCQNAYTKDWQKNHPGRLEAVRRKQYRQNKAFVAEYLISHPCVDCFESDSICLEFDHIKGKKIAAISSMASWGYSLDRIEREIEKCEVRCANCHRKVTGKRRKKSKFVV